MLRQLPNLLSISRGLCAVPLIWLITTGQWPQAFWLGLLAGLTDLLDGWLAKRYGWQSRLGAALDGLADKTLLLGAFVALVWAGHLPGWWLILVLSRDLLIVLGTFAYNTLIDKIKPQPSALGKAATFAQIVLALAVIAGHANAWQWIEWQPELLAAAALLTLASGVHYAVVWSLRGWRVVQGRRGQESE
jgi:cardiolipin synthase